MTKYAEDIYGYILETRSHPDRRADIFGTQAEEPENLAGNGL